MRQKIEGYKLIWKIIKLFFKFNCNKYFVSDLQKVCNRHKNEKNETPEFYAEIEEVLDEWMYTYLDYRWRVSKR